MHRFQVFFKQQYTYFRYSMLITVQAFYLNNSSLISGILCKNIFHHNIYEILCVTDYVGRWSREGILLSGNERNGQCRSRNSLLSGTLIISGMLLSRAWSSWPAKVINSISKPDNLPRDRSPGPPILPGGSSSTQS